MHILIHSIFGTRKGTNISVLNSVPSPSLQPPTGFAVAAQSSISGPSLPLPPHMVGGDAPAGLGLARVLAARPGALAQPSPLAELWCAPRPFRCCVEEGQQAESCWGLARSGGPETVAPGGAGPWHPPPAISLPGPLPRRGLASFPHCRATTERCLSASDPKVSCPRPVCAHVRVCETLGVPECIGALRVPEWGAVLRGPSGLVWGLRKCAQGACL